MDVTALLCRGFSWPSRSSFHIIFPVVHDRPALAHLSSSHCISQTGRPVLSVIFEFC